MKLPVITMYGPKAPDGVILRLGILGWMLVLIIIVALGTLWGHVGLALVYGSPAFGKTVVTAVSGTVGLVTGVAFCWEIFLRDSDLVRWIPKATSAHQALLRLRQPRIPRRRVAVAWQRAGG